VITGNHKSERMQNIAVYNKVGHYTSICWRDEENKKQNKNLSLRVNTLTWNFLLSSTKQLYLVMLVAH